MSLVVFDQYAKLSTTETVSQSVEKFNGASNGAITLVSAANDGDFSQKSYYKEIAGLVRRRNQYGSGAVSAADLEQLKEISVKVAAGTPPINIPPHLWTWIQKSPEEAGAVVGQQLGLGKFQDMLNTGITAAVAALSNVGSTVVHDGTAETATLAKFVNGNALMGDAYSKLSANMIHSKVWNDLLVAGLTNSERLFNIGDVTIFADSMGKPFIVTDSPALITSGSPDTYHSLSLVNGGVMVEENNDTFINTETKNGDENIGRTYQAEWTYNVGLKGFAWDTTNGGKSPNDAALGTGTNWDKIATSIKNGPGVLINTQ